MKKKRRSLILFTLVGALSFSVSLPVFAEDKPVKNLESNKDITVYNNIQDSNVLIKRLNKLEKELVELKRRFAGVSRVNSTLRFSGMNLQIVSGNGATGSEVNGLGNLIVGYNEVNTDPDYPNKRTGSHNIVVGAKHSYSSYGGLVVGFLNSIEAPSASITSGAYNVASGTQSSVCGGSNNYATNYSSSVSGGIGNFATGISSSISGGTSNTASGLRSSISGGFNNEASGKESSISGGYLNEANGVLSTVSGGYHRIAAGIYDWRAGGYFQTN